jgi:uncharacterized membrane protein
MIMVRKKFGLCFCHHRPDRSIWFFGLEKYLCARCFGIILGFGLALIINQWRSFDLFIAFFLIIPLLLDGFTQAFGLRESNNLLRLITGVLMGFAIPPLCYGLILLIMRNINQMIILIFK